MSDGITDAYRTSEKHRKRMKVKTSAHLYTDETYKRIHEVEHPQEALNRHLEGAPASEAFGSPYRITETPQEAFSNALRDMQKVLDAGSRKHGVGSWKEESNLSLKHKTNCDSMFHHLAEHYHGIDKDPDSGVDPLLHLACRALMQYERKHRK